MKGLYKIFLLVILGSGVVSCVDDYTDANPPEKLDAPTFRVSAPGTTSAVVSTPVDRFQSTHEAFVLYNSPSTFTVSIINAPGGIGEVSVEGSVPDFGTITVDESSVAAIQGQKSGDFTFTFTPNPDLAPDEDRSLNITVTVSDSQTDEDGEAEPKSTTLTLPTTLVNGCLSTGIESGFWMVTEASGVLDGGEAYNLDTLKKYGEVNNVFVELEEGRPGVFTISDLTTGLWPTFYPGRALPEVELDLCGNVIDDEVIVGGIRRFFADGTVNSDGTITISWSYERADAAPTPANPAHGAYTLTKF